MAADKVDDFSCHAADALTFELDVTSQMIGCNRCAKLDHKRQEQLAVWPAKEPNSDLLENKIKFVHFPHNQFEIEESVGENINFDKNPNRVYRNIFSQASADDLIIIAGSNYIAKEIFHEK